MNKVTVRFGVTECDRMRPMVSGAVPLPGIDPVWEVLQVQALFNRMLATHEFDVCEYPIATYMREREGQNRYIALPFFTSRHFRLSSIFVSKSSGIKSPKDLAGRRIGVPIWDMAAAVWLRGILDEHFDLPRTSPIYVTGGLEHVRDGDEHPQVYPDKYEIREEKQSSLADALAAGTIDALYTARAPSTFGSNPNVERLFASPQQIEQSFYKSTGIFPMMHVLCIKRSIVDANPELPKTLFDACLSAQRQARATLYDAAALDTMLPWQLEHLLETEKLLGKDYWASGVAGNRTTLETLIRYMIEDDLLAQEVNVEDLFHDDLRQS